MVNRRIVSFTVLALIVAAFSPCAPASAETLVESNVDSRLVVSFRVAGAELQKWIPAPWQVTPPASGPSRDANLNVVFVQRFLSLDGDGKAGAATLNRVVALAAPVKNAQTGETGPVVIRIYTSDHDALPGPYKNSVKAGVRREQTHKGEKLEAGTASDLWEMQTNGGRIEVQVAYQRGVPSRVKAETNVRSAVQPDFFRIYRVDQGLDVVKSVPAGVDRTQGFRFRSTVPELAKLFDGAEQLVSVTAIPFYIRQVSLP